MSPARGRAAPSPANASSALGVALEDPPLVRGEACFAADDEFSAAVAHARGARADGHGRIVGRRYGACAGAARRGRGRGRAPTSPISRPYPFRAHQGHRAGALLPAHPGAGSACATSASRWPVVFADSPYRARKTRRTWLRSRLIPLPPIMSARDEPGEFLPGLNTEPTVIRKSYGDVAAAFAAAHAVMRWMLSVGRHSGVPLECRGAVARYDAARRAGNARRRQEVRTGTATKMAKMLGRALSGLSICTKATWAAASACAARSIPEDVLVCAAALRLPPADQMDRGPPRGPHGHQPFARTAAPDRGAIDAEAHPGHTQYASSMPRAPTRARHGARVADMSAGTAAGPLSRTGLRSGRPLSPGQQ